MRRIFVILLACLGFGLTTARAAHTEVSLLLPADAARPGDTVLVGLDLKMDDGWHTYWRNPGESGIPTDIKWTLPPGVTAGAIQWPLPHKLPPAEVTTYGYVDEVVLLVPLTLSADLKPGQSLSLQADLSWLECKEQCVPGSGTVNGTLAVGAESKPTAAAATIASWQKQVPVSITNSRWKLHAAWEKPADGDTRELVIDGEYQGDQLKPLTVRAADLFPEASDAFEIQPAATLTGEQPAAFHLHKSVKKFSGDWPGVISGVIVLDTSWGPLDYDFKVDVANHASADNAGAPASAPTPPAAPSTTPPATPTAVPQTATLVTPPSAVPATPPAALAATPTIVTPPSTTLPATSLPQMMLYAFLGGLLLNIMPCVLPVIALKIFGFISEAGSHPRRVRLLGLVYALGVIVSFMVVASIVIGLKAAGHQVGWGTQFGNPIFLVGLTTLVLLIALNFFGVFEVNVGGKALDSASKLASGHGYSGTFFNGLLATIMGTSCAAPFMGAALGFAFSQSASVIVLIFLLMGLGLSAPYVALSWNPALLKFLPKPGAWMERFKICMGFPMLAALVWLFTLSGRVYESNLIWLGFFLVLVALAAWIYGEFVQRARKHPGFAMAVAAIIVAIAYFGVLENELHWRTPPSPIETASRARTSADGIDWEKWSPEAVAEARLEGHPVLVDFTADWCANCLANKRSSIEISSVRKKLRDINAVTLIADYTLGPTNITTELNHYGLASVPLVLVFPKEPQAPAIPLPAILTPGTVLAALDRADK